MKVLDLFAGLHGWSQAFKDRGHDVTTVEINPELPATIHADVRDVANDPDRFLGGWRPDVLLASPPCPAFSVAGGFRHFTPAPNRQPRDAEGRLALELVQATLTLVDKLAPSWWWMENPRGLLRKMPLVKGLRRVTVTYCQYGEAVMKPTDLWGNFPPSWKPKVMCANMAPCHVRAPRGSRTGTQGEGSWRNKRGPSPTGHLNWRLEPGGQAQLRAVVPYALSASVADACEDPTPRRDLLSAYQVCGDCEPLPVSLRHPSCQVVVPATEKDYLWHGAWHDPSGRDCSASCNQVKGGKQ